MTDDDRIADVIDWARSRIAQCQRDEAKFSAIRSSSPRAHPPQSLVEAWTERRALRAVIRMLEGAEA